MTRAEKFIADNPLFVRHGKEVVAPFEIMALLLEKYHQLCLPTDEEMDECYRNPANEPEHYFRAMLEKFRDGVAVMPFDEDVKAHSAKAALRAEPSMDLNPGVKGCCVVAVIVFSSLSCWVGYLI